MSLDAMGWENDFAESEYTIARVMAVDRDRCTIKTDTLELSATVSGKFRFLNDVGQDYPCVGDWVGISQNIDEDTATIHQLLPRKSYLRRKTAGKVIGYQMIAANIDTAFIVQSCHFDFNLRRLERYLVMVNEGGIEPVIVLAKIDLVDEHTLHLLVEKIRKAGINSPIIMLSSITGIGVDEIQGLMAVGITHCLRGSSGVGKTTLTNQLIGHSLLETNSVSGTGEGRHTTVRRQLIMLDNGSMLIDTPGMRELGILGAQTGISESYEDITAFAMKCRFSDCSHTNEPGCAVLKALKNKLIDSEHYNNYLKIRKESDFNEMSYLDKRKKDKNFGKMIKRVKKEKNILE